MPDPDERVVWLITRFGTFRKFTTPDPTTNEYQTAVPSDEYRTLTWLPGTGWKLRDLGGTEKSFDTQGLWTQTVDRNGNTTTPTYTAGRLASVLLPDQRSLAWTYHSGGIGRLESITEAGINDELTRTWSYEWGPTNSDQDLSAIDLPDGTRWEFVYDEPLFPGFMTRVERVGTNGTSSRVHLAWDYDTEGNVVDTWRGDTSATGPNAVERYQMSFDDPAAPTETTVTGPLGDTTIYTVSRDTVSGKPRVEQIAGTCPVCGSGPNSTMQYLDYSHPLKPSSRVDGEGNETKFTYTHHGQIDTKIEAVDSAAERMTKFVYNATFPAFVEVVTEPSSLAGSNKITTFTYNGSGDRVEAKVQGFEENIPAGSDCGSGTTLDCATDSFFNGAGRVTSIDPPGYGTTDLTSWTYDPDRGDLLPDTRTDPENLGTTAFVYDDLNRLVRTIAPTGLVTDTQYETPAPGVASLDLVVAVIQRGTACDSGAPSICTPDPDAPANLPTGDLETATTYGPIFKDLAQTIQAKGNREVRGYDAIGRLVSVELRDELDATKERTLYALDARGNRENEKLQSWDAVNKEWDTASETAFEYGGGGCQLTKIVRDPMTTASTTEYRYDCNGRLTDVADAENSPLPPLPTRGPLFYDYDDLNRLALTTQAWGGPQGGTATTQYEYDRQDHLVEVTDPENNVTTYTYSDRDLLTTQNSTASGATTNAYNEHGELVVATDANSVTTVITVDGADRVNFVDYPTGEIDATYHYGDGADPLAYDRGRLVLLARAGSLLNYRYDIFGRVTRDGNLFYQYDANSNRSEIAFPQGLTATYTHDFADREASLAIDPGSGSQTIVSSASYLPEGPLSAVSLGNGLTESRGFDGRYFPTSISVGSALSWAYGTDGVGNILSITDALNETNNRQYTYQPHQYFLTCANGPWGATGDCTADPSTGNLRWTYEKVGNRLSETRDGGAADLYDYFPGSPLRLMSIAFGSGGAQEYQYDQAGNLTSLNNTVPGSEHARTFEYDDANRMRTSTDTVENIAIQEYDGRGFLFDSLFPIDGGTLPFGNFVTATYSSDGILLRRQTGHRALTYVVEEDSYVFHFAGRPIATWEETYLGPSQLRYLTTDHLGTPVLALDSAGSTLWEGGFEPFGKDYTATADANGVFLRFPGQWTSSLWSDEQVPFYYNVNRWYEELTGRYSRPDPLGLRGGLDLFGYGRGNPLVYVDELGLTFSNNSRVPVCYRKDNQWGVAAAGQTISGDVDGVVSPNRTVFGPNGKTAPDRPYIPNRVIPRRGRVFKVIDCFDASLVGRPGGGFEVELTLKASSATTSRVGRGLVRSQRATPRDCICALAPSFAQAMLGGVTDDFGAPPGNCP